MQPIFKTARLRCFKIWHIHSFAISRFNLNFSCHFPLFSSPWVSKQIKGYFLLLIFSFLDWTMPFPSSSFLWLFFCKLLVSTILSSEFLNPLPSESTTARLDVVLLLRPYHHQEKEGNYVRQNSYLYSVGWWMSSLYDIVDSCSAVILCNTPQAQNNCFLSSHSPSCTFPDNIYPS